VLKETEGKGPYCSLVMAVVVVKDVLLFATFAVNVELARTIVVSKRERHSSGVCEGRSWPAWGWGCLQPLPSM